MRLLLALGLAVQPALAAAAPVRSRPEAVPAPVSARPLVVLPLSVVASPSLSQLPELPAAAAVPSLPSAAPALERSLPAAERAAAPPERPLLPGLIAAAESGRETAAGAERAPAEQASAAGGRDMSLVLGEVAPAGASASAIPASEGSGPAPLPPSGGGPSGPQARSVRRMFAGSMAFKAGMEAMTTSVPFVAMSSLGGATAVALLVVVTYGLAQAVFSSFTGALTDRYRAAGVLSGALAAQGVLVGAMLGLSLTGVLRPWMLFPVYALVGGAVGVAETARRVIPPLILGRDQDALRRYNARMHRYYETAGVLASAATGLLLWKFGAMKALIIAPPALILASFIIRSVRHGRPSRPVGEPGPGGVREAVGRYLRDLRLGARTIAGDPRLRVVAVAMLLPQIIHRIFEGMLLPVYAKTVLAHEALSPALLTASNLGELLGATLLLRWAARHPASGTWVRWGAYGLLGLWALSAVQLLHVAPFLAVVLLAPAVLASSLTWAASHLSLETEVQERVPREVQPRVFSLLYGGYVVGAAAASYLIGRLLDAATPALGFLGVNAAFAAAGLLVWLAARRLKPSPPQQPKP